MLEVITVKILKILNCIFVLKGLGWENNVFRTLFSTDNIVGPLKRGFTVHNLLTSMLGPGICLLTTKTGLLLPSPGMQWGLEQSVIL